MLEAREDFLYSVKGGGYAAAAPCSWPSAPLGANVETTMTSVEPTTNSDILRQSRNERVGLNKPAPRGGPHSIVLSRRSEVVKGRSGTPLRSVSSLDLRSTLDNLSGIKL
jgi:hypothetical protein